ncbi:hypothetical protein OC861_006882, partial [Tilletia horrida]
MSSDKKSGSTGRREPSTGIPTLRQPKPGLRGLLAAQHSVYLRQSNTTTARFAAASQSSTANRSSVQTGQWPEGFLEARPSFSALDSEVNVAAVDNQNTGFHLNAEPKSDHFDFISDDLHGIEHFGGGVGIDHSLSAYADAVFVQNSICCVRITGGVWALEGWMHELPEVGCFYHVAAAQLFSGLSISCDCAAYRSLGGCIHCLLLEASWSQFEAMAPLSQSGSPDAVEIGYQLYGRIFWLSVLAQDQSQSSAAPGMHKRCIVNASTVADWECNGPSCRKGRLSSVACLHRRKAYDFILDFHGPTAFEGCERSND